MFRPKQLAQPGEKNSVAAPETKEHGRKREKDCPLGNGGGWVVPFAVATQKTARNIREWQLVENHRRNQERFPVEERGGKGGSQKKKAAWP